MFGPNKTVRVKFTSEFLCQIKAGKNLTNTEGRLNCKSVKNLSELGTKRIDTCTVKKTDVRDVVSELQKKPAGKAGGRTRE
jgi:hypothetical protein